MSTTTTLSAIQKVFYVEDTLHKQFNQRSVLYDKLWKKWETDASGKNYTYAVVTNGLSNAGSGMSEAGDYPASAAVGVENVVIPDTQIATPVELSGRVIRAATGPGKGAFVSAVRLTVEQAMKSMINSINRQLHSDGTDALAFSVGADDTTPALFDDNQGNPFVHIPKGGTITCDLIDAASAEGSITVNEADVIVSRGAAGASSVSLAWTSGTLDSVADGDYLVLANTIGKQLMGIRGAISASNPPLLSTTGLHGMPVATKPFFVAQSFLNSGTNRDLTLELMQRPLTTISVESDYTADDVKFLLCNGPIFDKYIALCVANKQHVNRMELDGGQSAVSFNGKPLILDAQCRRNTIYYIVPDSMAVLTSSGGIRWSLAPEGGSQWERKIGASGQTYADAFQTFLEFYGNLAVKVRNANAVLGDLTE